MTNIMDHLLTNPGAVIACMKAASDLVDAVEAESAPGVLSIETLRKSDELRKMLIKAGVRA